MGDSLQGLSYASISFSSLLGSVRADRGFTVCAAGSLHHGGVVGAAPVVARVTKRERLASVALNRGLQQQKWHLECAAWRPQWCAPVAWPSQRAGAYASQPALRPPGAPGASGLLAAAAAAPRPLPPSKVVERSLRIAREARVSAGISRFGGGRSGAYIKSGHAASGVIMAEKMVRRTSPMVATGKMLRLLGARRASRVRPPWLRLRKPRRRQYDAHQLVLPLRGAVASHNVFFTIKLYVYLLYLSGRQIQRCALPGVPLAVAVPPPRHRFLPEQF